MVTLVVSLSIGQAGVGYSWSKILCKCKKVKQVHVGMEPMKTNQSRWEWHHNTFTPSLHLATTYTKNMLCVCQLCAEEGCEDSGVGSGSWVCSASWCAWGPSVVGGCNVVAILSMADMICLACMQKMSSVWAVLDLYDILEFKLRMLWNFIVAEHGRYGLSFMWNTME